MASFRYKFHTRFHMTIQQFENAFLQIRRFQKSWRSLQSSPKIHGNNLVALSILIFNISHHQKRTVKKKFFGRFCFVCEVQHYKFKLTLSILGKRKTTYFPLWPHWTSNYANGFGSWPLCWISDDRNWSNKIWSQMHWRRETFNVSSMSWHIPTRTYSY